MTSLQKRVDGDQRSLPMSELTATTATPIATFAANLMPPEIIAARRLGWLKRRLAFALVALVALIGLGYVFALQSTSATRDDLDAVQSETATLQQKVGGFNDVLRLQGDTARIRSQLGTVMGSDLQWSTLLAQLVRVAPAGVVITDVAGEVAADPVAPGGTTQPQPGAYNGGGEAAVGSVDVSGSARDYRSVAAYVDALNRVRGFGSAEPGTLGVAGGRTTFTLTLPITKDAIGGRFTPKAGK